MYPVRQLADGIFFAIPAGFSSELIAYLDYLSPYHLRTITVLSPLNYRTL